MNGQFWMIDGIFFILLSTPTWKWPNEEFEFGECFSRIQPNNLTNPWTNYLPCFFHKFILNSIFALQFPFHIFTFTNSNLIFPPNLCALSFCPILLINIYFILLNELPEKISAGSAAGIIQKLLQKCKFFASF